MSREAGPFVLALTQAEADELEPPAGEGGHQGLQSKLLEKLQGGNLSVELSDTELGQLVRYMTRYGSGGFQARLRRAFIRPLKELLA